MFRIMMQEAGEKGDLDHTVIVVVTLQSIITYKQYAVVIYNILASY